MKPFIITLNIFLLFSLLFRPCYSQESRETAQLLTTPESFKVKNAPDELWYKYIADSLCTLTISTDYQSSDEFFNTYPCTISLYKGSSTISYWNNEGLNCCNGCNDINPSTKSEVSAILEVGDEIFIQISKSHRASNLSISFAVTNKIQGTTFQNPIPVSLDSIPMLIAPLDNIHSYVYFEFSPQENMLANMYALGLCVVELYQLLPDGSVIEKNNFYKQAVYAGETYIFGFPKIYTQDVNWYMIADTVEIGYDCSSPLKISDPGVVEIENSIGSEWVKVFAEKAGYYTISLNDSKSEELKLIFSSSCYNDQYYNSLNNRLDTSATGAFTIYLSKGEGKLFNVSGAALGSSYSMTLTYNDVMQGDSCSTAIEVDLNSNYVQINPKTYFSFTPSESGDYVINLNKAYNTSGGMTVLDSCGGYSGRYSSIDGGDIGNAQAKFYFKKDSTYTIYSFIYSGFSSPSRGFSVTEYTPIKGAVCSDAIEVSQIGSRKVDHPLSDIWLQYKAEFSGTMYVSTLDSTYYDTNIQIYKDDCNTIIAENNNYMNTGQSYVKFTVGEGDIILIKSNFIQWGYRRAYPITIGYTEMYKDGFDCKHPFLITKLSDTQTTEYSSETTALYYTIVVDDETEITITDGNPSNFLQVFSDCETRIASSESGDLTRIFSSGKYTLEWFNTSAEDIVWNISVNNNPDTDKDGTPNATDEDDDNDGVPDSEDLFPYDARESIDTDGDGIGNFADTDDDGDGILDVYDMYPLQAVTIGETENASNEIFVQPNPVENNLSISGLDETKTYLLQIIDNKGSVVFIEDNYTGRSVLNVSHLATSTYKVVIQDVDNVYSTTFFKKVD